MATLCGTITTRERENRWEIGSVNARSFNHSKGGPTYYGIVCQITKDVTAFLGKLLFFVPGAGIRISVLRKQKSRVIVFGFVTEEAFPVRPSFFGHDALVLCAYVILSKIAVDGKYKSPQDRCAFLAETKLWRHIYKK